LHGTITYPGGFSESRLTDAQMEQFLFMG
jgi:hypothetical protein